MRKALHASQSARFQARPSQLRIHMLFFQEGLALPHFEGSPSPSKKGTTSRQREWITDAKRLPSFVVSTSKARIVEVVPRCAGDGYEQGVKEE